MRDGLVGSNSILQNVMLMSFYNITSSMYGFETKPGLSLFGHHSHNNGHSHQAHSSHPMYHLSTMSMNLLHQSHMYQASAHRFHQFRHQPISIQYLTMQK